MPNTLQERRFTLHEVPVPWRSSRSLREPLSSSFPLAKNARNAKKYQHMKSPKRVTVPSYPRHGFTGFTRIRNCHCQERSDAAISRATSHGTRISNREIRGLREKTTCRHRDHRGHREGSQSSFINASPLARRALRENPFLLACLSPRPPRTQRKSTA